MGHDFRRARPTPETSLEQTLTLASLVERETPKPEERPLVAGVFANRLQQGMPLQCDPTVVYALELAGQYSGRSRPASCRSNRPTTPIATRLAARADREPRRSLVARGSGSREDRLSLFRRQHGRRPFFQQDARGAQSQRRQVSVSGWRRSAMRRDSSEAASPAAACSTHAPKSP